MNNLNEFIKVEEHTRIVSAWKFLPWWTRKLLMVRFQLEVLRIQLPDLVLRAIENQQKTTAQTVTQLQTILHVLPDYYRNAPAEQVNTDLRAIIEHITVTIDKQISIKWRN